MNKIICITWLLLTAITTGCAQHTESGNTIIPAPVSYKAGEGNFLWTNKTALYISTDIDKHTRRFLSEILRSAAGTPLLAAASSSSEDAVRLVLNKGKQQQLGKEGYTLEVTPSTITISANEPGGLFYGVQSLLQMLPVAGESGRRFRWKIPVADIVDYPRFAWRGVMLDVSRHFFPKAYIEQLLNEMAKYKFNVFHWHLTDDQGWRIEIKGLPQLTEVGAWRVPRSGGRFGEYKDPQPGEKPTYGGYYTQDDIKEIVQYAKARNITVVPEIDVPGHSMALIASYPEISCRQEPAVVNPGAPLTEKWDNVLCVANDSTYIILDTIFSQVARLFPGPYIHLGGDEVYKGFWKKDSRDIALMAKEHINNMEELQSYFVKKVARIINSKGKKVIGWEEILQGGLTPGAVVTSWTGIQAGIQAAKLGHQVIMSPWDHGLYMDHSPIERSYAFDPVPEGVDKHFILGGEGCLWTEDVTNKGQADRMYWPRLMALSEVFWTPADKKNWDDFTTRMEAQFPRLKAADIEYAGRVYQPLVMPVRDSLGGTIKITMRTEIKGLKIYYDFNGAVPDQNASQYTGGLLALPKGAKSIRAVSYRDGKPLGEVVTVTVKDLAWRLRHTY